MRTGLSLCATGKKSVSLNQDLIQIESLSSSDFLLAPCKEMQKLGLVFTALVGFYAQCSLAVTKSPLLVVAEFYNDKWAVLHFHEMADPD